jgi:hypothetical protein
MVMVATATALRIGSQASRADASGPMKMRTRKAMDAALEATDR